MPAQGQQAAHDETAAMQPAGQPCRQLGPGVYDVHSPRVPSVKEIETLLADAERQIPRGRLWVNPDCGLKTRTWDEVMPALEHVVAAAKQRRLAPQATTDQS